MKANVRPAATRTQAMIFEIVPIEEVSAETAIRKATQKEHALTPSKMTMEQQQMGNPILTKFAVSSYIQRDEKIAAPLPFLVIKWLF